MAPARAATSPLFGVLRQGAIYTLGMLASRLLSLVMVPVYTRYLGPADYGRLELLDTLDLVVLVVFSSAIADPVLRHVHDAPDEASRKRVISTAVLTLLAVGAAVALAGFALSPTLAPWVLKSRDGVLPLRLTLGSVVFQAVLEVPLAVLRADDRPGRFVGWTLGRAALGFALNITFVAGLRLGVTGMALSSFVSSAVVATALVALTLRDVGVAWEYAAWARMVAFGWPLVPGALAMVSMQHTRSFMLAQWCTLEEVGVWGLGLRFGALVSQVLGAPLRSAWSAQMYRVWDGPDGPRQVARAALVVVALCAWAAAALSAVAPDALAIVAPAGYARAAWVVPAAATAYACREVAEFFRNGLILGRRPVAVAWIEPSMAALDVCLGAWWIRRGGLHGAVAAFVVVFAVYALLLHGAARRALPTVRYPYARMAGCALIAAGLCACARALPVAPGVAGMFARAAVVALFAAPGWVLVRGAFVTRAGEIARGPT